MLRNPQFAILIKRSIKRGAGNVVRERQWAASFGALFGVFLILQVLLFGFAGAQTMEHVLKSSAVIRVEMLSDATERERQEFYGQINTLSFVEHAVYTTKEQALESARTNDPELAAFLEKYNMPNPFSDTVGITLRSFDGLDDLAEFIRQEQWKNTINPARLAQIGDQKEQVAELLNIVAAGRSLAIAVILVAVFALMFTVTELVRQRVASRSDEIFIENLVGADPSTVTMPFIVETTILLWLAAFLSLVLAALALAAVPLVSETFQLNLVFTMRNPYVRYLNTFIPVILAAELVFAPLIAGVGAWLGVRPQLMLRAGKL